MPDDQVEGMLAEALREPAEYWPATAVADLAFELLTARHKARLSLSEFTPAEKDVSRAWLADHGFAPKGLGEP